MFPPKTTTLQRKRPRAQANSLRIILQTQGRREFAPANSLFSLARGINAK
jgi:hypothetical protein